MKIFETGVYVGEYQHQMDEKGRLTIPSKWRLEENKTAYLALPNPIGCITIYPPKMLARLEAKVAELSLGDEKGQKTLMRLFAMADTLDCDKQGRMVLSEPLRKQAGLEKEATLVGSFTVFHIWQPSRYTRYMQQEETQESVGELLSRLGL